MSLEDHGKNIISVGPWGGQDGYRWKDGVFSTVRQLVIAHGAGIDSIRIEYDKNGMPVWSEQHGGTGGSKIDKVKLEYPNEFLTSIHGHYGSFLEYGPVFIRSLTFESNKKTYGPYGIEQGMYFTFPMSGGKIVGFHGKCGWHLDAIGAYLEPLQNYDMSLSFRHKDGQSNSLPSDLSRQSSKDSSETESKDKMLRVSSSLERVPLKNVKGVVTYGAWGGSGGTVFDDGVYAGIRQIHLKRNVGIVSIRVLYEKNGEATWGTKNGGHGGFKSDKITFDSPYEILTHITGSYGSTMIMGPTVIKSLSFHTTKTKYGPFGEEQGNSFSTNLREGKIVGFHGRKGLFVDAIGVHVVEGKVMPPIHSPSKSLNQFGLGVPISTDADNSQGSNKLLGATRGRKEDQLASRVVKEPAQGGPGPWGGDGGRAWDDGVFSGIKQIHLTRSEAICSIQIEYDRNGQSVWSTKHGGEGGGPTSTIPIKFEYPDEVVSSICGFYDSIRGEEGQKVIKSITIYTSRRKCGPYGEERGTFFTSAVTTEGKIVGFHGRSGTYLDAIGVHTQLWLGSQGQQKPYSLRKKFL